MKKSAVILTALYKEGQELTRGNAAIAQLPTRPPEIAVNRLFGAVPAVVITMREYICVVSDTPQGIKYLRRQPILTAADI